MYACYGKGSTYDLRRKCEDRLDLVFMTETSLDLRPVWHTFWGSSREQLFVSTPLHNRLYEKYCKLSWARYTIKRACKY